MSGTKLRSRRARSAPRARSASSARTTGRRAPRLAQEHGAERPAEAGQGEQHEAGGRRHRDDRTALVAPTQQHGHQQDQGGFEQPRDESRGHRVEPQAVAGALLLLLGQQADERVEQEPPGPGSLAHAGSLPLSLGRADEGRAVHHPVPHDLALRPRAHAVDDEAVLGKLRLRQHLVGRIAEDDRGAGERGSQAKGALRARAQRQEPAAPHLGRRGGAGREPGLLAVARPPPGRRLAPAHGAARPTSSSRRARRKRRGRASRPTAPRPCRGC